MIDTEKILKNIFFSWIFILAILIIYLYFLFVGYEYEGRTIYELFSK